MRPGHEGKRAEEIVGGPTSGPRLLIAQPFRNPSSDHDCQVKLRPRPAASFSVSAPLAAVPGLPAGLVAVFLSPAHARATVQVPPVVGVGIVGSRLCDVLGRSLRTMDLLLPATGLRQELDLRGVAEGCTWRRCRSARPWSRAGYWLTRASCYAGFGADLFHRLSGVFMGFNPRILTVFFLMAVETPHQGKNCRENLSCIFCISSQISLLMNPLPLS